jgi:hypothetical protein
MICNDCRNNGICKHTKEAEEIWQNVFKAASINITCPIKVKVECIKFEKIPQKQDGLWSTYRKVGME